MIVRRSIANSVLYMLAFGILIIWGFNLAYQHDNFGMLFIFVGVVFIVLLFFKGVKDRSARIIIDDAGITATEFPVDKIYWKDITNAKLTRFPRLGQIITFELYDESIYTGSPPKNSVNRLLGLTTFCIMVEDLDVSPEKIYGEITSRIATQPQNSSPK